jgi:hypothetical protein
MNAPRRIYDQVITNFPSETWFREVSDADFNCVVVAGSSVAGSSIQAPPLLPTRPSAGRQVEPAGVEKDCGAALSV